MPGMSKQAQIIRVVELYYIMNLTQQEIAEELSISRPTVARLLDLAVKQGIVQIKLNIAGEVDVELSQKLRQLLNVPEVIVVDPHSDDELICLEKTTQVAAEYAMSRLSDDAIVGISWGQAMHTLAVKMDNSQYNNIRVIQLAGGIGEKASEFDGSNVANILSDRLSATCYFMYAPAIVNDDALAKELIQTPALTQVIDLSKRAELFLTGIGSFGKRSSLIKAGYFDDDEVNKLKEKGVTAHILGHLFTREGEEYTPYSERIISIPLENLKNTGTSIGVAIGINKASAVISVSRASLLDVIVIDKSCALEIIKNLSGNDSL